MTNSELLLKASFPAQAAQLCVIRKKLHDTFAAQACPRSLADQWVLAINEACMNIIQHAYGCTSGLEADGDIIVEVLRNGDEWTFRLTDFAKPVDKTKCCSRDLDDIRPGGLGIHFIHEIMDEVKFLDSRDAANIETADCKKVDCITTGNILQMKSHLPHHSSHKEEPDA